MIKTSQTRKRQLVIWNERNMGAKDIKIKVWGIV